MPGDESGSESSVTDTIGTPHSKKKEVGEDVGSDSDSEGPATPMSEENNMTSKKRSSFQKVILDKVAITNEELYGRHIPIVKVLALVAGAFRSAKYPKLRKKPLKGRPRSKLRKPPWLLGSFFQVDGAEKC